MNSSTAKLPINQILAPTLLGWTNHAAFHVLLIVALILTRARAVGLTTRYQGVARSLSQVQLSVRQINMVGALNSCVYKHQELNSERVMNHSRHYTARRAVELMPFMLAVDKRQVAGNSLPLLIFSQTVPWSLVHYDVDRASIPRSQCQ